jgi:hypothetical protein
MERFKKIVYIAHPYGSDPWNEYQIKRIILELTEKYPDIMFMSPVPAFSFMYNIVSYEHGMDMCFWILNHCDECWFFGDYTSSKGCMMELNYCKENNISYKIINKENGGE